MSNAENYITIGPRPAHLALALDNDVLNDWRAGKLSTVQAIDDYTNRVKVPPALTATTVFEMFYGFERAAVRSGGVTELTRLDIEHARTLTRSCVVLPFNAQAAEIAAYVFPRLSKSDQNRLWADVFIASSALAHEYGVATRNRADFERIASYTPSHYPALRLEIWK